MYIENANSLMRQMGITDVEIDRRLHMFNFTERDRGVLRGCSATLSGKLTEIIDVFYERQLENEEIAAKIGEPDTLGRLRLAMTGFLSTLFTAEYDDAYINSRLKIGKVHKALSVTPKLYMSGVSTLHSVLDEAVDSYCPGDKNPRDVKAALHKALLFDTQLVFDAYIDGYQEEMEQAREEVNRYAAHLEIKVEALTRQLHEQSIRDGLTGLYNRQTFLEYLERELNVAKRYQLPLTLAYFDLNGFKAVNDTFGHDAGDDVLRQVGESLQAITRSVDIACRYGGDEFCIIMPRCDLKYAHCPLDRLFEHFDAAKSRDVTFSIGVVQVGPDRFEEPDAMLREADDLMYKAKARARTDPGHHVQTPGGD